MSRRIGIPLVIVAFSFGSVAPVLALLRNHAGIIAITPLATIHTLRNAPGDGDR